MDHHRKWKHVGAAGNKRCAIGPKRQDDIYLRTVRVVVEFLFAFQVGTEVIIPDQPSSVNLTYLLCTNHVVCNHATRFGRPERSNDQNRSWIVARFRSGKDVPSISVSKQTTVRVCAPPSADQPKWTHALEISSARAVSGTRSTKHRSIWCCPGKGTPSSSRIPLAHEEESVSVLRASVILGRK